MFFKFYTTQRYEFYPLFGIFFGLMFVFWPLSFIYACQDIVQFPDAIRRGQIQYRVILNPAPENPHLHVGKCLQMTFKNTTAEPIALGLMNGLRFKPADQDSIQAMILTESKITLLMPGIEQSLFVYAMCGEKRKAIPNVGQRFVFEDVRNDTLMQLTRYLESNQYQNLLGQQALWAFTDRWPLYHLCRDQETQDVPLLSFVGELLGIPVPDCHDFITPLNHVVSKSESQRLRHGTLEFQVMKAQTLYIEYWNSQKGKIRVLKVLPDVKAGIYQYLFEVMLEDLPVGKHLIRVHNGKRTLTEVELTP